MAKVETHTHVTGRFVTAPTTTGRKAPRNEGLE